MVGGPSLEPHHVSGTLPVLWGPWLSSSQGNPLLRCPCHLHFARLVPLPGHLLQEALQADPNCGQCRLTSLRASDSPPKPQAGARWDRT